jgi:putative ABC transport system permease protein
MTYLLSYLEEAIAALWRNRVRSILTMLGMIIGSASIIAVFGISRAATSGITGTFASLGVFPVDISVDNSQDIPSLAAIQYRDSAMVAQALGDRARDVEPSWQRTFKVVNGNVSDYETVSTKGSYVNDTLEMAEGRKIDADDVDSAAAVCVITEDLVRKYFNGGPAVGNFLRINGTRCEVVGVWADIKGSFLNSGNTVLALPYTTFYRDFGPGDVDDLLVFPADKNDADAVGKAAVQSLQHIHGTRAKYQVQNGAGFMDTFDNVLNVIATGLSAIGGVALVVAGIGIMNIMLVSVTERTREIGIRKAIGANRGNIVLQFLMEAIVLSLIGGGIGMALGIAFTVGVASLLSSQLGVLIIPYVLIVSIAVGFSLLIGVVFGTYPALRAANLDPIEALRS